MWEWVRNLTQRRASGYSGPSGTQWDGWGPHPLVPSGYAALAGALVSPESALSLVAVYAAINVISTDVACLPLKLYRRSARGGREEVRNDPRSAMLGVTPDGISPAMRWRQAWIAHMLGWGNGYAEIVYDGATAKPARLYLMDPATTRADQQPGRPLVYRQSKGDPLPPDRVLHLAGLGYDGISGYSPVTKAREAIGLGMAAESFGSAFFGNGSQPRGVLKVPQKLSEEAAKRMRQSWEDMHKGPANSNRVAILEQGTEWMNVTIPPEDAQFLATRQFQVLEVARLYRLPPHKIGDYSQSHLANIEAANIDYMTTTLMPWCEAIEQELNLKLLTEDERDTGYYFEHQMNAFARGDMKARAEFYTKVRDLGALSPNEIRERENLNPIENGDIYLVPLNMTSLENAGKQPEAVEPAIQPPDDEGEDDEA